MRPVSLDASILSNPQIIQKLRCGIDASDEQMIACPRACDIEQVTFAADLKHIYQSATVEEAEVRLAEFEQKWDAAYPPIGQSWRLNWSRIIQFSGYPPEIMKVIFNTNAIESVNMSLRKITKNRGSFPAMGRC